MRLPRSSLMLLAARACAVALVLAAVTAPPAGANDSSGFQGTTGIELTKNDAIRMLSEDLFISPREIRVEYVFRNVTDHPVQTMVVFPLPDLDLSPGLTVTNWGFPVEKPDFLDFRLWVDGKPLKADLERRAVFKGRDVTVLLEQAGVLDLTPWQAGAYERQTKALPGPVLDRLRREGLLAEGEDPDTPQWSLRTRYFWTQEFPPGRDVHVRHTYRPFVGHALLSGIAGIDGRKAIGRLVGEPPADDDRYCLDQGTRKTLERLVKGANQLAEAHEIEYILTTARNWRGPIGQFHLTIDKGRAGDVASLCWPGLRKTGPTTFEADAADFVPDRDIRLVIFHVPPPSPQ